MYAANTSDSRIVGRTRSVAATFMFGKFTFAAKGLEWAMDWLGAVEPVGDLLHHRPRATGHGHRS